MAHPVETLRWRRDRLELLDQRALPQRVEYVPCATAAEVAEAIRDMVVRGAPAIGCAAAFGDRARGGDARRSASLADFYRAIEQAFVELGASRPTAVNLFWALDRMRRALRRLAAICRRNRSRRGSSPKRRRSTPRTSR